MILKERDKAWRKLAEMEMELLLQCNLTDEHRKQIEQENYMLKSGNDAESTTAFDLSLRHRESANWIVLHDLRLVDGDDVAQIDRLLMVRTLDFFVLETKNYSGGVKIFPSGEFEAIRKDGSTYPIPSPIAQNDRHIVLLKRLLKRHNLLPHRLGLAMPHFHNHVLVSTRGRLLKAGENDFPEVVKSDLFFQRIDDFRNGITVADIFKRLPGVISTKRLQAIGEAIASWHQPPSKPGYRKRFGITESEMPPRTKKTKPANEHIVCTSGGPMGVDGRYFCYQCRQPITPAEAHFCFDRPNRFGGRAYCRTHQIS
ncbi:MAG: nuclease-related domain-containing protein [Acidithiobacillus sp.]